MLTFYYKPSCFYSSRVLAANQAIGAPLVLRNVAFDRDLQAELIAKGGKMQVPFLEDTDRDVRMYESTAIIAHLKAHYGPELTNHVAS